MLVERGSHPLRAGVQRLRASVVKGFQRGSKTLGFPTANMEIAWDKVDKKEELSEAAVEVLDFMNQHEPGIYYGWAQIRSPDPQVSPEVHKAAVSIGWNPTFSDVKQKVIEPWILHEFGCDFYGAELRLMVCGYVRPELKFDDFNDLIVAIREDGDYCSVELDKMTDLKEDKFFTGK